MREYLDLGSAPCDEDCVQVRREGDYMDAMRAEVKRYRELVETTCMVNAPEGPYLSVKWNEHDFGSYAELRVVFDDNDETAAAFGYWLESHVPTTWDDTSIRSYPPEPKMGILASMAEKG